VFRGEARPFRRYAGRGDSVPPPAAVPWAALTTLWKLFSHGAAGAIGRSVCIELLRRGHVVRGFDLQAMDHVPGLTDALVGDLADRAAVDRATAGMDSIVHLGAYPNDAAFMDVLLGPNVIGLFNVMDAARQASMRRVVLASSMQVISGLESRRQRGPIRVEDGTAPKNHYALTKVWMEHMAEMYWRCYELSSIAVRIGWTPRDARQAEHIDRHEWGRAIYLSHDDAGRFFAQAIEAHDVGYAALFAVSCLGVGVAADMEPARQLIGFEPRDTWPAGLAFEWSPSATQPAAPPRPASA
jgi:uronate dehydrogenase